MLGHALSHHGAIFRLHDVPNCPIDHLERHLIRLVAFLQIKDHLRAAATNAHARAVELALIPGAPFMSDAPLWPGVSASRAGDDLRANLITIVTPGLPDVSGARSFCFPTTRAGANQLAGSLRLINGRSPNVLDFDFLFSAAAALSSHLAGIGILVVPSFPCVDQLLAFSLAARADSGLLARSFS